MPGRLTDDVHGRLADDVAREDPAADCQRDGDRRPGDGQGLVEPFPASARPADSRPSRHRTPRGASPDSPRRWAAARWAASIRASKSSRACPLKMRCKRGCRMALPTCASRSSSSRSFSTAATTAACSCRWKAASGSSCGPATATRPRGRAASGRGRPRDRSHESAATNRCGRHPTKRSFRRPARWRADSARRRGPFPWPRARRPPRQIAPAAARILSSHAGRPCRRIEHPATAPRKVRILMVSKCKFASSWRRSVEDDD